jgi:hypothetical protein
MATVNLHPLDSLDVVSSEFFPFTKLKLVLKGRRFHNICMVQELQATFSEL